MDRKAAAEKPERPGTMTPLQITIGNSVIHIGDHATPQQLATQMQAALAAPAAQRPGPAAPA